MDLSICILLEGSPGGARQFTHMYDLLVPAPRYSAARYLAYFASCL